MCDSDCVLQIMRQAFVIDNVRECEYINFTRSRKSHANKTLLIFQRTQPHRGELYVTELKIKLFFLLRLILS